jgi:hypothetical protein
MEDNIRRMVSLNGRIYMIWKAKMENMLFCNDLNSPIEGATPEKMSNDDWKKLNMKAIGVIRQ